MLSHFPAFFAEKLSLKMIGLENTLFTWLFYQMLAAFCRPWFNFLVKWPEIHCISDCGIQSSEFCHAVKLRRKKFNISRIHPKDQELKDNGFLNLSKEKVKIVAEQQSQRKTFAKLPRAFDGKSVCRLLLVVMENTAMYTNLIHQLFCVPKPNFLRASSIPTKIN